jgi:hypothetical protein
MQFKRVLPKILLPLGFILLFVLIRYQAPIKEFWKFNLQRITIPVDDFLSSGDLERNPPMSILQKETELKMYIGRPFKDFSHSQWRDFWKLIYGTFPLEEVGKGLPKRQRQLTQEEIKEQLASVYPQPFAYFEEEQWKVFFGLLLKR